MRRQDPVAKWMTPSPRALARTDTVDRASQLMREHGFRHLPVVEEGRLVGIVSERDMLVASRFADTRGMKVEIVMSPEPYAVEPSTPLAEVAKVMAASRHGAALVVEEGRVVGVFTEVDGLRALAESASP